MNTSGRSNSRTGLNRLAGAVLLAGLATTTGCGANFGAVIYHMGLVPEQKVNAEFKLPPGPILILVDDDMDLLGPPTAREALVEALALQLKEHKVAERVTTNEELNLIRRSVADFDKLSVSEVGKRANADAVIWMNIEDFYLEGDLEMMVTPARFGVKLKVFNPREEDRRKKRIWPSEREGRMVNLTVSPHEVRRCKNRAEAVQLMSTNLAGDVAKLFYDYKIERQ